MNINLEHYKYFYFVATCGSISGAAESLCISQPAVSQALKILEKTWAAGYLSVLPRA